MNHGTQTHHVLNKTLYGSHYNNSIIQLLKHISNFLEVVSNNHIGTKTINKIKYNKVV